jgi:hypothetical protein
MAQVVIHQKGPGLIPGLSVWDMWLIKWHWGQVSLQVLQTSPVIIIPQMLPVDSVSNFIYPLCQVVGMEHVNQVMVSRLHM